MPWLVGTALLHSLAATEKRGVFKSWTLLLAIFAFSLSLLGTFLVRSGVLTSVHAFASDPGRGYFILAFLALVIGGSFTLYAVRAPLLKTATTFDTVSKETSLLVNNLILFAVMIIVLLGTLYPLISDAMDWGKISVGPPYFNLFFIPLMALLLLLLPVGMLMKWKKDSFTGLSQRLKIGAVLSLVAGVVFSFVYEGAFNWQTALTVVVFTWVWVVTLGDVRYQTRNAGSLFAGLKKLSNSYKGMVVAHLGIAVTAAGVSLTSIYNNSLDVRMEHGQRVELGHYAFVLEGVHQYQGQNYSASRGEVTVYRGDSVISRLQPEKRSYNSDRGNMMTEAAIAPGFFADIYVSMGEALDQHNPNGAWAMRVHHKPFVRWVWLGAILMALGAILSVSDRRYRIKLLSAGAQQESAAEVNGVGRAAS